MKILVADPIAQEGIDFLRRKAQVDVRTGLPAEEIQRIIAEYDGLIVRSETKVTAQTMAAAPKLQVIGRAGVGVDNIDVEAATERGIIVVNAPTGNTIAAAEHTMALMLSMARHVPQADASMRQGKWARSKYIGTELRGKTVGIVGLGRVGSEVARRARAFDMTILAHDPYVSEDYGRVLGVLLVPLDELLRRADFITIHIPLSDTTKSLVGDEELKLVKPTVRIINAARGGIVDEQALYKAVHEGRVAGAAVDVFAQEPVKDNILLKSDKIVVTPHLGASTIEAQANVATEVADQVLAVLEGRPARYAVNAPLVVPEALAVLGPFVDVATVAANLASQLAEGQMRAVNVRYSGEIAKHDVTLLKAAVIRGLLASSSDVRVNVVNAELLAAQRGLKIVEQKDPSAAQHYTSLVTVEVDTAQGKSLVAGTQVGGETHLVRIDDFWMDVAPAKYMLLISNTDRPGMIGAVGTIAGKLDVNISFMEVGRRQARGEALMVLGLDEPMPPEGIQQLLAVPGIRAARQIRM